MELGGLGRVLVRKNFNRNSALPIVITGVVGDTPDGVYQPIMTTHVNKIANEPSMSSMDARRYRSENVANPRRGY